MAITDIGLYVRESSTITRTRLGTCTHEDLNLGIRLLDRWGNTDGHDVSGQFFLDDGVAGFELVIHDDD